jgi:hypothetical protein
MRRMIKLWLALLAAFWLTRAVVGALVEGRVEQGFPAQLELFAIPALQAMALAWATRGPRQDRNRRRPAMTRGGSDGGPS